jgi:hypothetical protein
VEWDIALGRMKEQQLTPGAQNVVALRKLAQETSLNWYTDVEEVHHSMQTRLKAIYYRHTVDFKKRRT